MKKQMLRWLAIALGVCTLALATLPATATAQSPSTQAKKAGSKQVSKQVAKKGARKSKAHARAGSAQTRATAPGKSNIRAGGRVATSKQVIRVKRNGKWVTKVVARPVVFVPPKPSFGELAGLHGVRDALELKSSVALVIDQDTQEVLFRKNDSVVLPIASITKLMTGLIVSEAKLNPAELITISQADVDTEKGSRSRLAVGTELTRGELMHLALMSSENRAAHALGRTYPGGMQNFVQLMNAKAQSLGMRDTTYVEPTGLSSRNQSSAKDLATLVGVSAQNAQLREFSTSPGSMVPVGNRVLKYNNTNRLIANPSWDIGVQKTGYISEAGQCLVMQAKVAGRKLIMVFLDSAGKYSRLGDAERVRAWLESHPAPVRAAGGNLSR